MMIIPAADLEKKENVAGQIAEIKIYLSTFLRI